MKTYILPPVILASLALAAQGQVLVSHDLRGDMDRTNQNLPDEAAWWKGGGSAIQLNESADGLVWLNTGGGSRMLSTNFVDNDATSTNTFNFDGLIMVTEYTFIPSNVGSGGLNTGNRFFLVNTSNATGARFLADNTSTANGPSVQNLTGYGVNFQVSTAMSEQALTIRKVDPTQTSTFSSNSSFTTVPTTVETSGDGKSMASGELYTLRVALDYTTVGLVTITAAIRDQAGTNIASVTATDSTSVVTAFDALMYRTGGDADAGGSHTITHWEVTAIPEPSTYAALLGLLALAVVVVRSRRQ